jgi:hypothetical protein
LAWEYRFRIHDANARMLAKRFDEKITTNVVALLEEKLVGRLVKYMQRLHNRDGSVAAAADWC